MSTDLINDKYYVPVDRVQDIAEKVMQSNAVDRAKVDALLHLDAQMYQNLGKESTKTEREKVKTQSRKLYRLIKTLNEEMGKRLLMYVA